MLVLESTEGQARTTTVNPRCFGGSWCCAVTRARVLEDLGYPIPVCDLGVGMYESGCGLSYRM